MEEYINDAIYASGDELLLEAYDKEWALKDLGMREGYQEGFEKGIREGREQGIEEGIEQGINDGMQNAKKELVCNMLTENIPIDLIVKVSGFSIDEINNIKK